MKATPLSLNLLVRQQKRGDRFAVIGQRLRRQANFGDRVDRVDDLASRQHAAELVGDGLRRLGCHGHADEIIIAAKAKNIERAHLVAAA